MFYSKTNILKSNFNESITMYDVSVIMFLKMANLRKLVDFVDCLKLRCEKCFNENSVIKNDTLH